MEWELLNIGPKILKILESGGEAVYQFFIIHQVWIQTYHFIFHLKYWVSVSMHKNNNEN